MEGTDWLEVERRARRLRAQEIRRLLAAALAVAVRAGGWVCASLARWRHQDNPGANDAAP